jgi:hypothetical protein
MILGWLSCRRRIQVRYCKLFKRTLLTLADWLRNYMGGMCSPIIMSLKRSLLTMLAGYNIEVVSAPWNYP